MPADPPRDSLRQRTGARLRAFGKLMLPPRPGPRDMVREREAMTGLLGGLGSYAWLITLSIAALTVANALIFFRGNVSYLTAVLERASLSGIASMKLITTGVTMIPLALILTLQWVASPRSTYVGRGWAALGVTMLLTLVGHLVTWLTLFVAAATYVLARLLSRGGKSDAPMPQRQLGVAEWGRRNLAHPDTVLRALADRAANSTPAYRWERHALASQVNERQAALLPSPAFERATSVILTLSSYSAVIFMGAATFSAPYVMEVQQAPASGYVIYGPRDAIVIDLKTHVPRVVGLQDISNVHICRPHGSSFWLLRSTVPTLRGDEPQC